MTRVYLAIDAATDVAGIAIGAPGTPPLERAIGSAPRQHASRLLPELHSLLHELGVTPLDLEGVVVGDGPGSFTGLRIAAALAKGLIHDTACPLFAVPSLLGCAARLARGDTDADRVAALYDALRGEVFVALWGRGESRVVPHAVRTSELPTLGPVALAGGPGALIHSHLVRAWTGRPPVAPGEPGTAAALLELLWETPDRYRLSEPARWEPEYGRPAEAQARWEARHGRPLPDPSRSA